MPRPKPISGDVLSDLSDDLFQQISHMQPVDRVVVAQRVLMLAIMTGPERQRSTMTSYAARMLVSDVHNVAIDNVALDITIHSDAQDGPPDFSGQDVAG